MFLRREETWRKRKKEKRKEEKDTDPGFADRFFFPFFFAFEPRDKKKLSHPRPEIVFSDDSTSQPQLLYYHSYRLTDTHDREAKKLAEKSSPCESFLPQKTCVLRDEKR